MTAQKKRDVSEVFAETTSGDLKQVADGIYVLLEGRGHDLQRCLAQSGVDHLETCIAQAPRHYLGPTIVTIETRLGDQHAVGSFAL